MTQFEFHREGEEHGYAHRPIVLVGLDLTAAVV